MNHTVEVLQVSSGKRRAVPIVLIVLSAVYLATFALLAQWPEPASRIACIIPVVVLGCLYGRRLAVFSAASLYIVHSVSVWLVTGDLTFRGAFFGIEHVTEGIIVLLTGYLAGMCGDLKRRIRIEMEEKAKIGAALRLSEERYLLAARASNDGLWDWDLRSGKISYSDRWKKLIGYENGEIADSPDEWFSRIHPEDLAGVRERLGSLREGAGPLISTEHRILHKKKYYLWVLIRGTAVRGETGETVRMAGSMTDITEKTVRDPLTGLPNRFLLLEHLDRQVLQYRKSGEDCGFAVLSIDVDNFSLINNSLGPLAGDDLLLRITARLKTCIRDGDMLGRLGADEFIIIMMNAHSQEAVGPVVDRIRSEFRKPCSIRGQDMMISVSIGIALSDPDHAGGADLIRDADIALGQAKREGTGISTVFSERMHTNAISRMSMESDLHQAVEQNQFTLYYQPIADITTLKTVGVEALIRWKHPSLGILSPDRFVFILEETGMIRQVGSWVLRQACGQLAEWKAAGLDDLYISANLSPLQLSDRKLPQIMKQILKETGIDPGKLTLEITETAIMEKSDTVLGTLANLHGLGVRLSVDDFGTGFSSVENIRRLPIYSIKIDRSFTEGCVTGRKDRAIVINMIELARGLEIQVIAEGVETETQVGILRENGCDLIQGFFIGPPVPPNVLEELYRTGRSVPGHLR